MKERGMIFNGEMVRAILDGRKTQTRRIMKVQPQPCNHANWPDYSPDSQWKSYPNGWCCAVCANGTTIDHRHHAKGINCPYGAVGDRIWVRETWAEAGAGAPDLKLYRANYPEHVPTHYENVPPADEIRWTPSIHMPRCASRITLEITGVRVERLNGISQEDAQAEGMELTGWRPTYSDPDSGGEVWTPYDNFAQLWESIYGEESWKANPWVWVIEFKRVEGGAA
ncbi:ASCH domain-containing protein [Citrobacter freundii]|uniref:hypothetical protein n=1 Tax=Citrobacter freundii TaxID=546 RepID=UPI001A26F475|nr:hypothetical protein [Citrobacter freundii]MCX2441781.1 hypothetical protein [Citrobacter freundii]MCX2470054.1 hypothetical protein [Citrobacter freundii]UZQ88653.1 hypothetical protein OQW59_21065 [Citrobacter freundii]UZQ94990.1 hypothetical protein OQY67_25525 [Citrobacter freundii]UZQ99496.1 hypothetical protein OQZ20_21195 [Citrobacter freundii]